MSISFEPADRIKSLPPYLFAELDRMKMEVKAKGVDVIDLGVGDPDLATPNFIIDALMQATKDVDNHHYPSYVGMLSFRQAVADWYKRRFSVDLDPNKEVVALIGSKEGIAHLPLALLNPGDTVLVPDPGYPVYSIASQFVGAKVRKLPLRPENNFLPDFKGQDRQLLKGAKLVFLNYPNNPTSARVDKSFFDEVVAVCEEEGVMVCHDNAYSELYYDGQPCPSFLEATNSKAVGIETHSLSKSFNMTGWRVGFAVGHAGIIGALGKVKTNVDSGIFQAVQYAGIAALKDGDSFLEEQRSVFQERRDALAAVLTEAGFEFQQPRATFYFWVKVPGGVSSVEFCSRALKETGVVVTPGVGMGENGDGFFRITITAPTAELIDGGKRLAKLLK
jgi:LL-diaminopimelate aminotransferase